MIALTLRFNEDTFPTMKGKQAGEFLLDMLKEHPEFAIKAANEVELKGDFGRVVEKR